MNPFFLANFEPIELKFVWISKFSKSGHVDSFWLMIPGHHDLDHRFYSPVPLTSRCLFRRRLRVKGIRTNQHKAPRSNFVLKKPSDIIYIIVCAAFSFNK